MGQLKFSFICFYLLLSVFLVSCDKNNSTSRSVPEESFEGSLNGVIWPAVVSTVMPNDSEPMSETNVGTISFVISNERGDKRQEMFLVSDWTKRNKNPMILKDVVFENDYANSVYALFVNYIDDSVPAATYRIDSSFPNEIALSYLDHDLGVYGGSVSARLIAEPGSVANVEAFGYPDTLDVAVEFIIHFNFK
ncbi:MAG: hypothetical protein AB8F78_16465 [Saprospiraceae bacterium]